MTTTITIQGPAWLSKEVLDCSPKVGRQVHRLFTRALTEGNMHTVDVRIQGEPAEIRKPSTLEALKISPDCW